MNYESLLQVGNPCHVNTHHYWKVAFDNPLLM